jgi:hypothetical protein
MIRASKRAAKIHIMKFGRWRVFLQVTTLSVAVKLLAQVSRQQRAHAKAPHLVHFGSFGA